MTGFWLPPALLQLTKAASFPAGSVVFCPPSSASKRATLAPAFRFDLKGEDGEVHQWLFWLQGGPWGSDEKRRTASLCREMSGADNRVAGICPSQELHIDVEIDLSAAWRDDLSWSHALGAIAATPTGFKIAAAEYSQYSQSPVPIDLKTWLYDDQAMRKQVVGWYENWRVRVSDGRERTYCTIDYSPPPAKSAT